MVPGPKALIALLLVRISPVVRVLLTTGLILVWSMPVVWSTDPPKWTMPLFIWNFKLEG